MVGLMPAKAWTGISIHSAPPHGNRQDSRREKGVGRSTWFYGVHGDWTRLSSVQDDRLHSVDLFDHREESLRDGRLRHDESVRIVDDLGVVHDHLADRDARLGDDRGHAREDARLRCVRRDDLDCAPVHEGRHVAKVAGRLQSIEEIPEFGVLRDRVDGRRHDASIDTGGAGQRGIGDFDSGSVHAALVDPKAVHDHELSDLLLRRKSFKVWTQPRPHAQTNAMHEKVPWGLNPLGFTCSSNVVAIAISVHQRTESLYNVQRFRSSPSVVSMQTVQPTSAGASDVKILLDREDSPYGSKKPNTAIAQAYFAAKEGIEAYATETGAGQWGSALALATNYFGMRAKVFMVRVSYDQKPYRKYVMRLYGAEVIPSPSDRTNIGKKILAQDPSHPGSLGVAISEAIETAVTSPNTRYSLGSVLNHVLLHQTVIGLEAQKQFELADVTPDFMVGSVGGGSNFAGFTYPTIGERIHGRSDTRFIAVEPTSVPSMTKGRYEYDFGDTGEMTPLVKMHTLGHTFVPPRIHAGGLRYHGTAATLSVLLDAGLVEPRAVDQLSTFQAGEIFAKTEGLIPAPETCHAIRGAIDLALEAKKKDEETVIAFNYSGHGLLDIEGYAQYLAGTLGSNGH